MNDIGSIILYYFVFVFACVLFAKADSSTRDRKIRFYILCGVIVLSLFAGLRGLTVGWDTAGTINARFDRVRFFRSFSSLMANRDRIKEPIYWVISYFIRKVTDSGRVFLFIMQLLTVGPIAIVAFENRDRLPVSVMMTTYMLLFYQMSFNIIRQSIAAAFLLLAFSKLMKKSYIKAAVLAILVCLFHNSGIIGVALILLIYILNYSKNKKLRFVLVLISLVFGILFLTSWQSAVTSLIEGGYISEDYDTYVAIMAGEVITKHNTFRYRNIVIEVLRIFGTLIMLFFLKGEHSGSDQETRLLKYAGVLSLLVYSIIDVGFGSTLGHRATIFLDYLQIILYASYFPKSLFENKKMSGGKVLIPKTGIQWSLLYCLGFNFMVYMIINFGHTIPYQLS